MVLPDSISARSNAPSGESSDQEVGFTSIGLLRDTIKQHESEIFGSDCIADERISNPVDSAKYSSP